MKRRQQKNHNNDREKVPFNENISFIPGGTIWYPPIQLNANMIGRLSMNLSTLKEAMNILNKLEPDEYSRYLADYYQAGIEKFGCNWLYSDIITTLLASAKLVKPQNYLEIGVRRGRSLAMVAATNPDCSIIGMDMWISNYANMENPGAEYVRNELKKIGYKGNIEFIEGNSHVTLPKFIGENPNTYFDMITVDGDHSEKGAALDLEQVKTRLKIGGVLVFDDITHPAHPYLCKVWEKQIKMDYRFNTWEFTDLGYGVAVGVRIIQ